MRSTLRTRWPLAFLITASLLIPVWRQARPAAPPPVSPISLGRRLDFNREVQPLLSTYCVSCHGPGKQKGGLRLDRPDSAQRTGNILPGKGADSPLVHRVSGVGPDKPMPPSGPRLTPRQIAILRTWIDEGAEWSSVGVSASGPIHWAYRPLASPPLPTVKNAGWVRNPIDTFILAALEAKGMTPAPEADRRSLIRRLSFDLIGLPPTPEEIDTFLNDTHADAYERLVDRLLASPHHGERWARHWLDVVHFAESHGHDQDVIRENAWPYRDYLIRAFNEDRPYAHFVEQQLAGDVLFPDEPSVIPALGMLSAGPWDESSQQSIRDDTLDKKVAQNLDRDDMLTTVCSTFVSTTIHCARCHDHKFDPITQAEYYNLQSVLAGVDRANRAYDPDPAIHRQRTALKRRDADLQTAASAELLTPAADQLVRTWEKAQEGRATAWTVLQPSAIRTKSGSMPEKLPDASVRFGGMRPLTDVYTVETDTELNGATAVRLEVLTDDSLPHRGPGRQDNGNLHLNEFRVAVRLPGQPADGKPIALHNPTADFNQDGWTAAHAIDGNPATAWGIYPAVGVAHSVVFEFLTPLKDAGRKTLIFTLEQTHGGGHLIGRLRLSATTAPRPTGTDFVPGPIQAILSMPIEKRSEAQRVELARFVLRRDVAEQLAALPPRQMVYVATSDFKPTGSFHPAKECRPVLLLRRGDVSQPGAGAVPGALSCISGLSSELARSDDEAQRRAALARWFTDRRNVLTWRSIVNRVWHYHIGRGIVATPGDLGKMGAPPTHPELLDWLAAHFRDNGGSLKALHRLIVTSAAYRQASTYRADYAKMDGDNLLLWRMNRTRLDAECVRDAVLRTTGKIDYTMGGPSVKHFTQSKGIHVTVNADYNGFDLDGPGAYRRSIYRFIFRTLPDPFLEALDCPDASQFTPARTNSITPLQALALLNDRFTVRQAEHFAARVEGEARDREGQVRRAFLLALGRPATQREVKLLADHAARHGMAHACRVLFNCNEFMFVP
jgi:Protein of unknown function (DUF1553)/Protein of unknown function (DUF1549)/Planctomycete cytochrome C